MEVHHHSHPDSYPDKRKKWAHYFWEFFMLFLAVFCGFLAENQREHYVEHLRGKQYLRSVIKDIEIDSARITSALSDNNGVIKGLDSLILILDSVTSPEEEELLKIYYLFHTWGNTPYTVVFSERTISQLKSAGGMRLIGKQSVSDAISSYYDAVGITYEAAKIYNSSMARLHELSYRFLDKLYTRKGHDNLVLAKTLFMNNPVVIREFINWAADLVGTIKNYNDLIGQLNGFGSNVIHLIKKEYHLK